MIATHEFVVPKSMPMILAMLFTPEAEKICCDELVDNPGGFKG